MQHVTEAFSIARWSRLFQFVLWLTSWLQEMQTWSGGCSCHEEELLNGKEVTCHQKGRRVHEAWLFATRHFDAALAQVQSWDAGTFHLGDDIWACQGALRGMVHLGRTKLGYLDKVPWLLSRLPERGIRAKCLEQFAAAPAHRHHRVTRQFLEPGSELYMQVMAMTDEGEMGPLLKAEVRSLRSIPLDDSVAEAPHAQAARISSSARAGGWYWMASTLRLKESLHDLQMLLPMLPKSIDQLWHGYKSLVQVDGSKARRLQPKRMQMALFKKAVYSFDWGQHIFDLEAEGDHPDDPGDPGAGRGPPSEGDHAGDEDEGGGSDEDGGGDGPPPGDGADTGKKKVVVDMQVRLLRQWLARSLQVHSYVSLPCEGEDGHFVLFAQVLSMEIRDIKVRAFDDEEKDPGAYKVGIQPLDRWAPLDHDPSSVRREENCFVYQDPSTIDMIGVCGGASFPRQHMKVWKPSPSDVEGCICLSESAPLKPHMGLLSADCPVLCLLDQLEQLGFASRKEKVVHNKDTGSYFDSHNVVGRGPYLQCVLILDQLLAAGVVGFDSRQSLSYYKLMLRTRGPIAQGETSKFYKRKFAELKDLAEVHDMMERMPDPSCKKMRLDKKKDESEEKDSDSEIAGDDDRADEKKDERGTGDDVRDDEVGGDEPVGDEPPDKFDEEVEGCTLFRVAGKDTGGWNYAPRLRVVCPHHEDCRRSRSTILWTDEFGDRACALYIGCWLKAGASMSADRHVDYKPKREHVRTYASL